MTIAARMTEHLTSRREAPLSRLQKREFAFINFITRAT
jgi:hypothetical protein